MPQTSKGEAIEKSMKAEYGPKKGERVFYASKNAGTISGVDVQPALTTASSSGPPAGASVSQNGAWKGRAL